MERDVPPLLAVRGLCAGYGEGSRRSRIVQSVNLEVQSGELWAILGPNGAGKSTLLRTCLGLLKPEAGTVHFRGKSLETLDRKELARAVAWVPQALESPPDFTCLEMALLGRSPHLGLWGLTSNADIERARGALGELDIGPLAGRPLAQLSGGERRLSMLARAFVQEPKLLLLDEPTAHLDLRHQMTALARVKARVREGMGAVAVLHDVNLAEAFADRVLLVKNGSVLASGTREILKSDLLEQLFDLPIGTAVLPDGQRLFGPRLR
jgi:iron complex transport system ATP-binding protein